MPKSTHYSRIENFVKTLRFFHLFLLSYFFAELCTLSPSALAVDTGNTLGARQAITLRIDNNIFAGSDHGYSNGINVGFLSQTVDSFQDSRLPSGYRQLNRGLRWLQPKGWALAWQAVISTGDSPLPPTFAAAKSSSSRRPPGLVASVSGRSSSAHLL